MRKPLFEGYDGERLSRAVQSEVPHISSADVPADLIQLALDCLQKDAAMRLELVTWERIFSTPDPNARASELDRLRDAIRRRPMRETADLFPVGAREQRAIETAYRQMAHAVDYHIRTLLNSEDNLFPRHELVLEQLSPTSFSVRATMTYPLSPSDIDVTLFISCTILDVASLLCRCELATCCGDNATTPPPDQNIIFYNGSFVDGAFSAALDQEVPAAIARFLNTYSDK